MVSEHIYGILGLSPLAVIGSQAEADYSMPHQTLSQVASKIRRSPRDPKQRVLIKLLMHALTTNVFIRHTFHWFNVYYHNLFIRTRFSVLALSWKRVSHSMCHCPGWRWDLGIFLCQVPGALLVFKKSLKKAQSNMQNLLCKDDFTVSCTHYHAATYNYL